MERMLRIGKICEKRGTQAMIANLDLIMGWCVLDPSMRGLVVALVMAVLSPIMAALGGDGDKPEIPRGEARGA